MSLVHLAAMTAAPTHIIIQTYILLLQTHMKLTNTATKNQSVLVVKSTKTAVDVSRRVLMSIKKNIMIETRRM